LQDRTTILQNVLVQHAGSNSRVVAQSPTSTTSVIGSDQNAIVQCAAGDLHLRVVVAVLLVFTVLGSQRGTLCTSISGSELVLVGHRLEHDRATARRSRQRRRRSSKVPVQLARKNLEPKSKPTVHAPNAHEEKIINGICAIMGHVDG
jgi:hypothetical protein